MPKVNDLISKNNENTNKNLRASPRIADKPKKSYEEDLLLESLSRKSLIYSKHNLINDYDDGDDNDDYEFFTEEEDNAYEYENFILKFFEHY